MKKQIEDGFNTYVSNSTSKKVKKEKSGKGLIVALVLFLLVLVIAMILIRMDVGGFGSKVLYPKWKDIPVLQTILPEVSDEQVAKYSDYKTLAQAVARINELEQQIAQLQSTQEKTTTENSSVIADLQAQIQQLKVYEQNQKSFEQTKQSFYEEVVYNDNVDLSDYTKWYESMDADTAAKLYKEAVKTQAATEQQKELAKAYAKMEPKAAAKILNTMTADVDTVIGILNSMSATDRGEIMGEMDSTFAAKITKKMTY